MKTFQIKVPKNLTEDEVMISAQYAATLQEEITRIEIEKKASNKKYSDQIKERATTRNIKLEEVKSKQTLVEYKATRKIDLTTGLIHYYDAVNGRFLKFKDVPETGFTYDENELSNVEEVFDKAIDAAHNLVETVRKSDDITKLTITGSGIDEPIVVYDKEKELQAEEV